MIYIKSSLYTEYGLIEDGKLKDYLYKQLKKKQIILLKSICNKNNLYIKAVLHPLGWHDWIFQIHLNETPFLVSDNQIVLEFKIRSKMFFNNFKFECSLIPNETFYENTFSFSVDDFDIDKIFKRYQEL